MTVRCLYAILLVLSFVMCSKGDPVFTEEVAGKKGLFPSVVYMPCDTDARYVDVEGIDQWVLSSHEYDWVNIEKSGESQFLVSVLENRDSTSRKAQLSVESNGDYYPFEVVQACCPYLAFVAEDSCIGFECIPTDFILEIRKNVIGFNFKIDYIGDSRDWLEVTASNKVGGDVFLKSISVKEHLECQFLENFGSTERSADIIIYSDSEALSDTIRVSQASGELDYYTDGTSFTIQRSLYGDGANIVVMGDGFTTSDFEYGGCYETAMRKAAEYIFTIDPYRQFQDYFNVYSVVAISDEAGVSEGVTTGALGNGGGQLVDNKFGSVDGEGTAIDCDDKICFEYAQKVPNLPLDKPLYIILVLNSDKYAGTCILYQDGNSIAMCPMSKEAAPNDFEGLVHHEFGGHGFGFLADEYVYYDKEIPKSEVDDLLAWQKMGYVMNVDFTEDISSILWKDFTGLDKYSAVGAYQGASLYRSGIWRSEEKSCMDNNIPYYNAQSRWIIVKRLMELIGIDYTIQDFIDQDRNTSYQMGVRSLSDQKVMPPLGQPQMRDSAPRR